MSEVIYSVNLYNQSTNEKCNLNISLEKKLLQEIYDIVFEISYKLPNDIFLLDIEYSKHICNKVCNGVFHHEIEEENSIS